jgi:hypothetical protein
LFQVEVSEISDGTIEVKGIAREPGFRTKIAVWTRDDKVDPVGACVGLRGQRVKNIVRELNNEKVDIIKWSPNIREFISNALNPASASASPCRRINCHSPSASAARMRGLLRSSRAGRWTSRRKRSRL